MDKLRSILVIEDSDEDFEVACWALNQAAIQRPIIRAANADEALTQLNLVESPLECFGSRPALILLDLNLPGLNGRELLKQIKNSEQACLAPVVVLSTSNNPRDIEACYRMGAAGYICKPLQLQVFADKIKNLMLYWFSTVNLP
jgi:CheY-like chemotaxis protein